jgi:hypothetical protein
MRRLSLLAAEGLSAPTTDGLGWPPRGFAPATPRVDRRCPPWSRHQRRCLGSTVPAQRTAGEEESDSARDVLFARDAEGEGHFGLLSVGPLCCSRWRGARVTGVAEGEEIFRCPLRLGKI